MKAFLTMSGVSAVIILIFIAIPLIQKDQEIIEKLEQRIIFCDSINEINCKRFNELDTTYDIGLEIYKKHLEKSKKKLPLQPTSKQTD